MTEKDINIEDEETLNEAPVEETDKEAETSENPENQEVPWMSGLVYGLQNRLRRFESARHLTGKFEDARRRYVIVRSTSFVPPARRRACP